jgi:hypothetical protein
MRFLRGTKPPVMPMPAPAGAAVKPKITGAPATPTNPKSGFAIGPQNINPVRPMSAAGPKTGVAISPANINPIRPRMKKGGKVSSASSRADGCAVKGKTKGKMV